MIISKANTVRGLLQHNLRKCSIEIKSLGYKSLLNCIFPTHIKHLSTGKCVVYKLPHMIIQLDEKGDGH